MIRYTSRCGWTNGLGPSCQYRVTTTMYDMYDNNYDTMSQRHFVKVAGDLKMRFIVHR